MLKIENIAVADVKVGDWVVHDDHAARRVDDVTRGSRYRFGRTEPVFHLVHGTAVYNVPSCLTVNVLRTA